MEPQYEGLMLKAIQVGEEIIINASNEHGTTPGCAISLEQPLSLPPDKLLPPKKPLRPYFRFKESVWGTVRQQHPDISLNDTHKFVGSLWRDLPDIEKQKYSDEYSVDKLVYENMLKEYEVSGCNQRALLRTESTDMVVIKPDPDCVTNAEAICFPSDEIQIEQEEMRFIATPLEVKTGDDLKTSVEDIGGIVDGSASASCSATPDTARAVKTEDDLKISVEDIGGIVDGSASASCSATPDMARAGYGVRLMLAALKASGCPVDISRNVSCETCEHVVTGGYDPATNQIVVCQNTARKESMVQGILVHELIHMFDYCTKKLDFTNLEHLACTEIRAANLTHCSFMSSVMQGDSSPFNIRQTHQDCVKNKAACSLVAARGVTKKEAVRIVDLVFPKCYADLEPIGRRVRRNSTDIRRAYLDRHRFGYV